MISVFNRLILGPDSDAPVSVTAPANSPASWKSILTSSPAAAAAASAFGFQVLRNKGDVPVDPWYDFIVGINGRQITDENPDLFATEIRNCAGSSVSLTIFSAKGQRTFHISIPIPPESPTLGLTLQWAPLSLLDNVWHVSTVTPHGPADTAGILPDSDYIVGSPDASVLQSDAALDELIEDYIARELRLYVYNREFGVTRLVSVTPSRTWGGEGALGCGLANKLLHRLPAPLSEGPVAEPGESLFEGVRLSGDGEPSEPASSHNNNPTPSSPLPTELQGYTQPTGNTLSGDVLVPASMEIPPLQPPPATSSTPKHAGGRRGKRGGVSPSAAFDEYFKEGETKSREEDVGGSNKSAPPPPPPTGASSGAAE